MLLRLLTRAFLPAGPVILGLDETVERRRGARIEARAIYRDAARSICGFWRWQNSRPRER